MLFLDAVCMSHAGEDEVFMDEVFLDYMFLDGLFREEMFLD